jgi:hypothetical protein
VEETPLIEAREMQQATKRSAQTRTIDQFVIGVHNLIDWILVAGEKWLLTLHEIGESTDEAMQLVKDHQQLELKADVSEL